MIKINQRRIISPLQSIRKNQEFFQKVFVSVSFIFVILFLKHNLFCLQYYYWNCKKMIFTTNLSIVSCSIQAKKYGFSQSGFQRNESRTTPSMSLTGYIKRSFHIVTRLKSSFWLDEGISDRHRCPSMRFQNSFHKIYMKKSYILQRLLCFIYYNSNAEENTTQTLQQLVVSIVIGDLHRKTAFIKLQSL